MSDPPSKHPTAREGICHFLIGMSLFLGIVALLCYFLGKLLSVNQENNIGFVLWILFLGLGGNVSIISVIFSYSRPTTILAVTGVLLYVLPFILETLW